MSNKTSDVEKEASAFAVCILIPKEMLLADLRENKLDLADDREWNKLLKKYQVTSAMMVLRMNLMRDSINKLI
jgi:Zn-dependent peptidase ImmA (M78 family)